MKTEPKIYDTAEEHLRLNGHNIRGAYIYVTSLYRTPDMIALREWILSLAASSDGKGGQQ